MGGGGAGVGWAMVLCNFQCRGAEVWGHSIYLDNSWARLTVLAAGAC